MTHTPIRTLVRAAAVSMLAATFGLSALVPADTLAAPSISLRAVGGQATEEVDRGTNLDLVMNLTGHGGRGNVNLRISPGLEFIDGTASGSGQIVEGGILWADADLPNGEVAFTASFRVLWETECGSVIAAMAEADGVGTSDASLVVTCGLGGGAGRVPQPATGGGAASVPGAGVVKSEVFNP